MKKLIVIAIATSVALGGLADTWTDSADKTWSYTVSSGKATITGVSPASGGIAIPSSVNGNPVTSIGSSAFSGCSGITSVTIPSSVTSIGWNAFSGCSGITSVTIPSSVTSIGWNAFNGCCGICSVHISDVAAWCGISFDASEANPLFYAKTLCLNDEPVANLVIPDGVESIRSHAFYNCTNIVSVTIPSSVTSIGISAFWGCSGLTSVTIPSGVTSIGDFAFYDCSGLTSVTIPSGVTSIGGYAFQSCIGLTSVTIPSSVTSIGGGAFWGCSGLTSVTIPSGVTSIGSSAFSGCSGLTSVTIPFGVTSIGSYAFSGCGGLTRVTIPSSVTSIGNSAFSGCSGLTSVTIPYGVTSIGDYAFSGCSGLTSVTIPASVTSIGRYAFYGCSGLTSVTIPSSVTSIGFYAFRGCSGLRNVVVPQSVCNSGMSSVFPSAYQSITNLVISDSVTSIGANAFRGCSGLTSVTIPSSVTSIGDGAFNGCSKLANIYASIVIDDVLIGFDDGALTNKVVWTDGGTTGGDETWAHDQQTVHSGIVSWKSGSVSCNQESWFEMDVDHPGRLSFWWKASSESDGAEVYDYAYLSVDEVPQGSLTDGYSLEGVAIGGKTDWVNVVIDVSGAGPHTIRWTYCKDDVDEADTGDDCVWLDDIVWTPKVSVSYDISGASGVVPAGVSELAGTTLTLPDANGFSKAKHTFGGWSYGAYVYDAGAEYVIGNQDVAFTAVWMAHTLSAPVISSPDVSNGGTIETDCATIAMSAEAGTEIRYTTDGSEPTAASPRYTAPFEADGMNVTIKAIAVRDDYFDSDVATFSFTRKPYSLSECLGIDGATVTTGGDSAWGRILGGEAYDGVAALKSGALDNSQTNWVQMTVSGPGTISFWWNVSSEGTNRGRRRDGCVFSVDGVEMAYSDGITNVWTQMAFEVDAPGVRTLKWAYGKNDNGTSDGDDCAWLDNVVWLPDAIEEPMPTIDDGANAEAVNAAVESANFADEGVKAAIGGSASEYKAFKTWASGVVGGEVAVVASTNATVSYLLGAERLFVNAPKIEFGECEVASNTGDVMVSITVKDGEDAVAVASDKVKEMFEATNDLGDWTSTGKKLTPTVTDLTQGRANSLNFKVRPGDGTSPSAFLRIRK